jgi:hypothetical protein
LSKRSWTFFNAASMRMIEEGHGPCARPELPLVPYVYGSLLRCSPRASGIAPSHGPSCQGRREGLRTRRRILQICAARVRNPFRRPTNHNSTLTTLATRTTCATQTIRTTYNKQASSITSVRSVKLRHKQSYTLHHLDQFHQSRQIRQQKKGGTVEVPPLPLFSFLQEACLPR